MENTASWKFVKYDEEENIFSVTSCSVDPDFALKLKWL